MTVWHLNPRVELAGEVRPLIVGRDGVLTVPVGIIINVCAAPTVSLQELVSCFFFFTMRADLRRIGGLSFSGCPCCEIIAHFGCSSDTADFWGRDLGTVLTGSRQYVSLAIHYHLYVVSEIRCHCGPPEGMWLCPSVTQPVDYLTFAVKMNVTFCLKQSFLIVFWASALNEFAP